MSFYMPEYIDPQIKQERDWHKNILESCILDKILGLDETQTENLSTLFNFILDCNKYQIQGLINIIKVEGNKLQIQQCQDHLSELKVQQYNLVDSNPNLIWDNQKQKYYTQDGCEATHLQIKQFLQRGDDINE